MRIKKEQNNVHYKINIFQINLNQAANKLLNNSNNFANICKNPDVQIYKKKKKNIEFSNKENIDLSNSNEIAQRKILVRSSNKVLKRKIIPPKLFYIFHKNSIENFFTKNFYSFFKIIIYFMKIKFRRNQTKVINLKRIQA